MASEPNEAEAWLDLQTCAADLDILRHPKDLREAMLTHLSKTWDLSNSGINFRDFGNIWIDPYYRRLVTKVARSAAGRQIWNASTFRSIRICRLEGHWDVLLGNAADWLGMVFPDVESQVTLTDYLRILNCVSPTGNLDSSKLKLLFWGGGESSIPDNRTPDFLIQLPLPTYSSAYDLIVSSPPDSRWHLPKIMREVREQNSHAKHLMLHVCSWFAPNLQEPGNRTIQKPSLIFHLKAPFLSRGVWKPRALALQETVLSFLSVNWPEFRRSSMEPYLAFRPLQHYHDHLQNPIWRALVAEIRRSTDVPFRHPDLVQFNGLAPSHMTLSSDDDTEQDELDTNARQSTASKVVIDLHETEQHDLTDDAFDMFYQQLTPQIGQSGARQLSHTDSEKSSPTASLPLESQAAPTTSEQDFQADGKCIGGIYSPTSSTKVVELPPLKVHRKDLRLVGYVRSQHEHASASSPQQPSPSLSAMSNEIVLGATAAITALARRPSNSPILGNSIPTRRRLSDVEFESNVIRKHRRIHRLPTAADSAVYGDSGLQVSSPQTPREPAKDAPVPVVRSPAARSKVEEAVWVLQEQYGNELLVADLLKAIDVLRNEVNAGIFLLLKDPLRLAWLHQEIQKTG